MAIYIDGRRFDGNTIEIRNGRVKIDGKLQDGELSGTVEIKLTEGTLASLAADGDVTCNDVRGNVSAGGSVRCNNIGGTLQAGGSVNAAGKAGGPIMAGGSVSIG